MRRLRTRLSVLSLLTVTAGLGGGAPGSAQAAESCAVHWGSLPKGGSASSAAPVSQVRGGEHTCFDRLVIDVHGRIADAYEVRYVDAVDGEQPGSAVAMRGGALLQVLVHTGTADQEGADAAYEPADAAELVDVDGWRTLRQVRLAGSADGQVRIGVGVRARLPFRVFVLPGADGVSQRLVVHVAHRW